MCITLQLMTSAGQQPLMPDPYTHITHLGICAASNTIHQLPLHIQHQRDIMLQQQLLGIPANQTVQS